LLHRSPKKETAMLQQLLINTPVWVWGLLAFLIFRGMLASVGRETGIRRLFIIPLVMLGLSMHGIAASFGADPFAVPVWLAATAAVPQWRGHCSASTA
jgi:hypothetical protein